MRDADDGDPRDHRVLVEDVLDVEAWVVLPAADDYVLRPSGDVEVALLVDRSQVAGLEPVTVEAVPGQVEALGVTDEQEGPAHLQPALLRRLADRAVEVDDPDLHPRP